MFNRFPAFAVSLLALVSTLALISCSPTPDKSRDEGPQPRVVREGDPLLSGRGTDGASASLAPVLTEERELSQGDLSRIGENFEVDLVAGANILYRVGEATVQCNHLIPKDQKNLVPLFHQLVRAVGNINPILLGLDRVYELIGTDPAAGETVRAALDLPVLQKLKLTPFSTVGEAKLLEDELIVGQAFEDVSSRLGIGLASLINQTVEIEDVRVRVNYLLPSSGTTAVDAFNALADFKRSEDGLYILEDAVVEVVTDSHSIAETVWRMLTVPPPSPADSNRFRLHFSVAPVEQADHMKLNDLALAAVQGTSLDDLLRIDPSLKLGRGFPLFTNGASTRYEWNPRVEAMPIDDSLAWGVMDSRPDGTLYSTVDVVMTVETARVNTEAPVDPAPYLAATPLWPVESPAITDSKRQALEGLIDPTNLQTAKALHQWVREHVRYGGNIVGSRYGVEQVLQQRFGRCWDLSDVFITLARASGLPARQVAGWIYGKDGHVWSQVWLNDEKRWLDVDTTKDELGIDGFYIPIWGTRDGEMLFLYTKWPTVERLGW